jgi:hypothetical protein
MGSMSVTAGSQFFRGLEPVLLGRSVWTAPGLPVFVSQGGDVRMSEGGDAVSNRSWRLIMMDIWGVLQGLPRNLVSGQVILFPLLLGDTMGVRGAIV